MKPILLINKRVPNSKLIQFIARVNTEKLADHARAVHAEIRRRDAEKRAA